MHKAVKLEEETMETWGSGWGALELESKNWTVAQNVSFQGFPD